MSEQDLSLIDDKSDIITYIHDNGCFEIVLNRPKQLNTLTVGMLASLQRIISEIASDPRIKFVFFRGSGEKAFCAGGDLKDVALAHLDFIRPEYKLDYEIAKLNLSKPFIALWDGIVMGGGVGLSHASRFIVATEKSMFAMPETRVGFIPDVAASFFLNRLPGQIGTCMALSGERLYGHDLVSTGLATHFIKHEACISLLKALQTTTINTSSTETVEKSLEQLLSQHTSPIPLEPISDVLKHKPLIDECFSEESAEKIVQKLQQQNRSDTSFSSQLASRIRSYAPTAVCASLRVLRVLRDKVQQAKTRQQALEALKYSLIIEYRIMARMLNRSDTKEGVTCLLFEKHRVPKFDPPTLAEVSPNFVESFFHPLEDKSFSGGDLTL